MRKVIIGKNMFSDDGFIPWNYDELEFKKAVNKISKIDIEYHNVKVIGNANFDFNTTLMLRYESVYDCLVDLETLSKRLNNDIVPCINCLMWNKSDGISVLAYVSLDNFLISFESEKTGNMALGIISFVKILDPYLTFIKKILEIVGNDSKITIELTTSETAKFLKEMLDTALQKQSLNVPVEIGTLIDEEFECYEKSDMAETNNAILVY